MAQAAAAADVIIVDGYDGESQVERLSSRLFYCACRLKLNAGGVLVVNLWGSDRRFNDYLQRIDAAYREVLHREPDGPGRADRVPQRGGAAANDRDLVAPPGAGRQPSAAARRALRAGRTR